MAVLSSRIALLGMIASALSGCVSMRPTMTSFSVDYNRVVGDTRNRMILLNIVRSAYREPTYYTAFSQIEGSLNMQTSATGQIANLIGGGATSFAPTVSGTITNAPTFTIVPLNSDEFSKGMLSPVGTDTIQLFRSQGWPARLLAPLVIQKVECIYDERVVAEIENEPDRFGSDNKSRWFENISFYMGKPEAGTSFALTTTGEEALKALTNGALDKFDIEIKRDTKDPANFNITMQSKTGSDLQVSLPPEFGEACTAKLKSRSPVWLQQHNLVLNDTARAALSFDQPATVGASRLPAGPAHQTAMNVVFRSTDGIVYYLGERLRARLERLSAPQGGTEDTLFEVGRNVAGPAAVAVDYRGARWSIAANEITDKLQASGRLVPVDRTLEVLSLLNQLISAQTSAKEFTRAPASVRVR